MKISTRILTSIGYCLGNTLINIYLICTLPCSAFIFGIIIGIALVLVAWG